MTDFGTRRGLDWGGRVVAREVMLRLELVDVAGLANDHRGGDRPDPADNNNFNTRA